MTRHISSEKARANWREVLDAVAAGETVVIERYGQPVATLTPYQEAANVRREVRESQPVYDASALVQLKAEIVADVLTAIEGRELEPLPWREGLALLQRQIAEAGGLGFGDDPEVIVE
mgnify:FL=1